MVIEKINEELLNKEISSDDGAIQMLNKFADEANFNAQMRLGLQMMYNIQRKKHSFEMAYTKTLLHLNWQK